MKKIIINTASSKEEIIVNSNEEKDADREYFEDTIDLRKVVESIKNED